jgi:hypothetical protein
MQLMTVFQILLLVAMIAGIFTSWDRRAADDRRDDELGGRRKSEQPDPLSESAPR